MTDLEQMESMLNKGRVRWRLQAELEPMSLRPSGNAIVWLSDKKDGVFAYFTFDSDGNMIGGGHVE